MTGYLQKKLKAHFCHVTTIDPNVSNLKTKWSVKKYFKVREDHLRLCCGRSEGTFYKSRLFDFKNYFLLVSK